jgi:hypothetical protein
LNGDNLMGCLYAAKMKGQTMTGNMLAFGCGKIEECRLDMSNPGLSPCLWVGHTAFEMSADEAAKVREVLPMLRVIEAKASKAS